MKELLDKLKKLIHSLETEKKSQFLFCAMFQPGDSYDRWHFIVSAPWLSSGKMESYELIASGLQTFLTKSESLQIERIVILDPEDETVKFLQALEPMKNGGGYKELRPEELTDKFRFVIKRAYLLRSPSESG